MGEVWYIVQGPILYDVKIKLLYRTIMWLIRSEQPCRETSWMDLVGFPKPIEFGLYRPRLFSEWPALARPMAYRPAYQRPGPLGTLPLLTLHTPQSAVPVHWVIRKKTRRNGKETPIKNHESHDPWKSLMLLGILSLFPAHNLFL